MEIQKQGKKKITISDVINATANHYGIEKREVTQDPGWCIGTNKPRLIAIYLAEKYAKNDAGGVCAVFGIRQNKIMHACHMVENELFAYVNQRVVDAVTAIKKMLAIEDEREHLPEQKVISTTASWFGNRHFYLDGTNICRWSAVPKGPMCLGNVLSICRDLRSHGAAYTVFFDASTRHLLREHGEAGDVELYERLLIERPETFREVPAGIQADPFLLMEASRPVEGFSPSVIVSNDRFTTFAHQYPFVCDNTRRVPGMIVGGEILFPSVCWRVPRLIAEC